MEFNIYCDESCHLQNDNSDVMVLGAISCPSHSKRYFFDDLRALKKRHGLSSYYEMKWIKASGGKFDFYLDVVKYFFEQDDLAYRAVVATNKSKLDHDLYNDGSYDKWYYKTYYLLLNNIIDNIHAYKIFIDIKDTRGGEKVRELHKMLCNSHHDYWCETVKSIHQINSLESELIQIVDILNGAMAYYHRGLYCNRSPGQANAKTAIIDYLLYEKRIKPQYSTSKYEQKFNFLIWTPREGR